MSRPTLEELALTRPAPAPDRGPLDERFYDLVEERFRRIVRDHPDFATFIGIHTEDHRLADGERDAVLGEIAADRAHLAAVEAIDPAGLSAEARFERDLEIHNLRRDIFDIGRPARLGAPLDRARRRRRPAVRPVRPRLRAARRSGSTRSPAGSRRRPRSSRPRAAGRPSPRSGCGRRSRSRRPARSRPCSTRSWPPARASSTDPELRRLRAAADGARVGGRRLPDLARGDARRTAPTTGRSGASATTSWSGCARSTASTPTRSSRSARSSSRCTRPPGSRPPARSTRRVDEATVVDRIKSDHPATFEAALDAYRDVDGPGPPATSSSTTS